MGPDEVGVIEEAAEEEEEEEEEKADEADDEGVAVAVVVTAGAVAYGGCAPDERTCPGLGLRADALADDKEGEGRDDDEGCA